MAWGSPPDITSRSSACSRGCMGRAFPAQASGLPFASGSWNPAKEWKRVSGVIEEMFTAGIKEQSLSYEDQVRRRVSRWRELVVYAFRYSNTEPCVSKFQDAASQV